MIRRETKTKDGTQMTSAGGQPEKAESPSTGQPPQADANAALGRPQEAGTNSDPDQTQGAPDLSALGVKEGAGHGVKVKGLHAYYGDNEAVKGIDIDFPPNEVTAIIGPSGCGKSTMVRCINRMHEEIPGARATGSVTLDGFDVYGPSVNVTGVRRMIGMVFQKPNPFPTMSIFDNVAAGLRLTGTKRDNLRETVHRALRAVGLWGEVKNRLNEPGMGLSGGQQQRLCIARTIAVEPEVILMDEPCSALDPIATLKVEELIDELKDRYTIVIVTHNMQQAARVANSTVFMLDGQVVEHAETNQLFTRPSDERTERYVTGKFG
jgi:phosphate transport system ATP-binding protein